MSACLLVIGIASPANAAFTLAQLPGPQGGGGSSPYTLEWVKLDGLDVFQVAIPNSAQSQRRSQVQNHLHSIQEDFLQLESPVAELQTTTTDNQPEVYVNGQYLVTITEEDAKLQGLNVSGVSEHLKDVVPQALDRSYQHRQPEYRRRQFIRIGIVLAIVIAIMIALSCIADRLVRSAVRHSGTPLDFEELDEDQDHHIRDLRDRLLPLVQGFLLAGTLLWAMGQFPETRVQQQDFLSTLKIPIVLGIVFVIAYIGVRLTYAVVDRFVMNMTDEEGLSSNYSRRGRLRISTLSSVIKNVANFFWIGAGFLIALAVTGLNLGVLLASVGIIGLAVSLAAQNLVQGAIKGFFIVLEDQFAIGDVVKIGDDAGLVENLNLRITQLRDTGGRLITIPTSDIDRVANYSLHWSRADLKIPVHYNADLDHMLDIARQVGKEMQSDANWGELILEDPQILGVDDFGESAVIIRIWIKTEPLKQWDVSREFRRRFKQSAEADGTEMPFPQRSVWLHTSDEFRTALSSEQTNGHSDQSKRTRTKTDAQPRSGVPDDGAQNGHDPEATSDADQGD